MGDAWNKAIAGGVLVAVAVGAGAAFGMLRRPSQPPPPQQTTGTAPTEQESHEVEAHVAGWVNRPGVVTLDEGSIVADAIARAGGLRPGAQTEAINLAAPVDSGDQIVVPGPGDAGDAGASRTSDGPISLNQATEPELETLPGVGPVLARRIVEFRETHGRYETVEDLLEVPGIGEAKLASLRDLVRP